MNIANMQGVEDGVLLRNVAKVVPVKQSRKTEVLPSLRIRSRFLLAAEDDPLEALYVFAVHTGCRQGKLLAPPLDKHRGPDPLGQA